MNSFGSSGGLGDEARCNMVFAPKKEYGAVYLAGIWEVEFFNSSWEKYAHRVIHNMLVEEGMAYILNAAVDSTVAQKSPWYIGLIDNTSTNIQVDDQLAAASRAWNEFTGYSGGNRLAWDETAASAASPVQLTTNNTSDFSITSTGTLTGLFLTDVQTAGTDTGGILIAAGLFSGGNQGVNNGDTLRASYTLTLANQ